MAAANANQQFALSDDLGSQISDLRSQIEISSHW